MCSLEQIIQEESEDAQPNKNNSPTSSTNVACRRLHSVGLCDIAHHTVFVSQANVSHECKCQESTRNSLKQGSAFATTMIWREARVVWAEAKKGRHTQLGSGCLSCTLAFPASRRQPCGKALKRVTASRMRTVIMPCPVYRSVRGAEPGFGRERRSRAWIVY